MVGASGLGDGGSDTGGVARVTVGAADVEIKALNERRVSILLKNSGATNISINIGAAAVLANHFPLLPGEAVTLYTKAQIKGIGSAGGGQIAYIEETN